MEIDWINKRDKSEVYKTAMDYCLVHSMTKENSSVLTLLLPPGNFSDAQEVKNYLHSFVQDIDAPPAIISIEPVVPRNDLDTMSLLKMYGKCRTELLPFYHAHILVKDDCLDSNVLRKKWNEIVGSKLKKLFQFAPVEKTIRDVVNYVTKFLEEKRGGCCQIGFIVQDSSKTSEVIGELDKTSFDVLRKVKLIFKNLIKNCFLVNNKANTHPNDSLSIDEKVGRDP